MQLTSICMMSSKRESHPCPGAPHARSYSSSLLPLIPVSVELCRECSIVSAALRCCE